MIIIRKYIWCASVRRMDVTYKEFTQYKCLATLSKINISSNEFISLNTWILTWIFGVASKQLRLLHGRDGDSTIVVNSLSPQMSELVEDAIASWCGDIVGNFWLIRNGVEKLVELIFEFFSFNTFDVSQIFWQRVEHPRPKYSYCIPLKGLCWVSVCWILNNDWSDKIYCFFILTTSGSLIEARIFSVPDVIIRYGVSVITKKNKNTRSTKWCATIEALFLPKTQMIFKR